MPSSGFAEDAMVVIERAVGLAPRGMLYRYIRANILDTIGRHREALREYEAVVAISPQFLPAVEKVEQMSSIFSYLPQWGGGPSPPDPDAPLRDPWAHHPSNQGYRAGKPHKRSCVSAVGCWCPKLRLSASIDRSGLRSPDSLDTNHHRAGRDAHRRAAAGRPAGAALRPSDLRAHRLRRGRRLLHAG